MNAVLLVVRKAWCVFAMFTVIEVDTLQVTCKKHVPSIQCGVLVSHFHKVQIQILQSSFH